MAKLRKDGKLLNGINNNREEINKLRDRVESLEASRDTDIVDDLTATKPGLKSPMFTYSEIAERQGVSKSKVQRIAEDKGLTRRFKLHG